MAKLNYYQYVRIDYQDKPLLFAVIDENPDSADIEILCANNTARVPFDGHEVDENLLNHFENSDWVDKCEIVTKWSKSVFHLTCKKTSFQAMLGRDVQAVQPVFNAMWTERGKRCYEMSKSNHASQFSQPAGQHLISQKVELSDQAPKKLSFRKGLFTKGDVPQQWQELTSTRPFYLINTIKNDQGSPLLCFWSQGMDYLITKGYEDGTPLVLDSAKQQEVLFDACMKFSKCLEININSGYAKITLPYGHPDNRVDIFEQVIGVTDNSCYRSHRLIKTRLDEEKQALVSSTSSHYPYSTAADTVGTFSSSQRRDEALEEQQLAEAIKLSLQSFA